MKHGRTKKIILIVTAIVLVWVIWVFVSNYYTAELNPATSAAPKAKELKPYIEANDITVLHTYNRHMGGWLNTNSSASFEYYLENPTADTAIHAEGLSAFLTNLGYDMQQVKYKYDEKCTSNTYGRMAEIRQYCESTVGTPDISLMGSTQNEGLPYWVLRGENGSQSVFAQVTDKDFTVTSNDFWRDEYSRETGMNGTKVRSGKSVTTIVFSN